VWRHRKKSGSPIDMEIKWSLISFKGRAAWLVMGNDITERKRIEHRDAALAKLGQYLSSTTSPAEAARIIHSVVDDLFQWNSFTLEMLCDKSELLYPILIVDTDERGRRFDADVPAEGHEPGPMVRRVIEHGGELLLRSPDEMVQENMPRNDARAVSV